MSGTKRREMSEALASVASEARKHANQIVLIGGDRLARLIGVAEDASDLYYVCIEKRGRPVWHSAVGGYVPIADRLGPDHDTLDRSFSMNGAPARTFCVILEQGLGKIWIEGDEEEEETIGEIAESVSRAIFAEAGYEAAREVRAQVDLAEDAIAAATRELAGVRRSLSVAENKENDIENDIRYLCFEIGKACDAGESSADLIIGPLAKRAPDSPRLIRRWLSERPRMVEAFMGDRPEWWAHACFCLHNVPGSHRYLPLTSEEASLAAADLALDEHQNRDT